MFLQTVVVPFNSQHADAVSRDVCNELTQELFNHCQSLIGDVVQVCLSPDEEVFRFRSDFMVAAKALIVRLRAAF